MFYYYRKLVVVCSRASLCDNCRIFQFTFPTKLGVAWVVYTWEFIGWQTLESLQLGIETDLDEFETITILFPALKIIVGDKKSLPNKMNACCRAVVLNLFELAAH